MHSVFVVIVDRIRPLQQLFARLRVMHYITVTMPVLNAFEREILGSTRSFQA